MLCKKSIGKVQKDKTTMNPQYLSHSHHKRDFQTSKYQINFLFSLISKTIFMFVKLTAYQWQEISVMLFLKASCACPPHQEYQDRDRHREQDQHNGKQWILVPFPVLDCVNISVQHIRTHCSWCYSLYLSHSRSRAV